MELNSVFQDIELVADEEAVPEICYRLVRACKSIDPEITYDAFITLVLEQCEKRGLDEDIIDNYESICIIKFDCEDAYAIAVERMNSSEARVEIRSGTRKLRERTRQKYSDVATLIYHLECISGKDAFLGCRKCGEFLETTHVMANRLLNTMGHLKIIVLKKKGIKGRASRWGLGGNAMVPDELKSIQTNRLLTDSLPTNSPTYQPTTEYRQPTTSVRLSTPDSRKGSPTPIGDLIHHSFDLHVGSLDELQSMVGIESWDKAYGFFHWAYVNYPDIQTLMDKLRNGTNPATRKAKGCGEIKDPGAFFRSRVMKWCEETDTHIPADKTLNARYQASKNMGATLNGCK